MRKCFALSDFPHDRDGFVAKRVPHGPKVSSRNGHTMHGPTVALSGRMAASSSQDGPIRLADLSPLSALLIGADRKRVVHGVHTRIVFRDGL
jgi:hypothetical protein